MKQYRKKPVVIEAVRWDGLNNTLEHLTENGMRVAGAEGLEGHSGVFNLQISTLEGPLHASDGDWIIKGIRGEFYPIKPDIFEATYEPVEEEK